MQLYLGHFAHLKSANVLLLSGNAESVSALADLVESFARSAQPELPLHKRAPVLVLGAAQLSLVKHPEMPAYGFAWSITPDKVTSVLAQLRAVAGGCPAHAYFELAGSSVQLVVSAGEYGPEWWQAQGQQLFQADAPTARRLTLGVGRQVGRCRKPQA